LNETFVTKKLNILFNLRRPVSVRLLAGVGQYIKEGSKALAILWM